MRNLAVLTFLLVILFFIPALGGAVLGAYYKNHWISAFGTATLIILVQLATSAGEGK